MANEQYLIAAPWAGNSELFFEDHAYCWGSANTALRMSLEEANAKKDELEKKRRTKNLRIVPLSEIN